VWTVTIPNWHPTRLNTLLGAHWAVAARMKKADRRMLCVTCHGIPKATGKRRVTLTIGLKPRQRAGDPDCYWKSLLDGLVQCKLLVDDNRQHVECMPVQYERGLIMSTTINLGDIECTGFETIHVAATMTN